MGERQESGALPLQDSASRLAGWTFPAPVAGEDAADDRVENAGDGAGNGDEWEGGEMLSGEDDAKTGVLHADFDGDGPTGDGRQSENFGEAVAGGKTEEMKASNRAEQGEPTLANDVTLLADDAGTNHHDEDDREEGRGRGHLAGQPWKPTVERDSEGDGNDDNLKGGHDQARGIDWNAGACVGESEEWGEKDSGQGRTYGHGHGERDIATGEKGYDVGRGASGTAGDQDQTGGEIVRQLKELGDGPCDERHEGELPSEPANDGPWHVAERHEIRDLEGDAHPEHDESEAPDDPWSAEPCEEGGLKKREQTASRHPKRKSVDEPRERSMH